MSEQSYLTRTFGVEMEFVFAATSGHDLAAKVAQLSGQPCYYAGYTHAVAGSWKIVTDGSLRHNAGEVAYEMVSPILQGEAGLQAATKVCEAMVALGARVNRSCGLHVHVGTRNESTATLRRLAYVYAQSEEVIDSLLPASRRASNNTYCGPVKNVNLASLARATDARGIATAINGGDRYCKLNYTAFWKYGTVEFRHHSGTVDAAKVCAWVKACLRMVACAAKEQEEQLMVPAGNEPVGNARLLKIYRMVARPEGASRQEIATMLNRRTSPPVAKILTQAGVAFEMRRGRYYIAQRSVPVAAQVVTLASWIERLEMDATEKAFWEARAALLANTQAEAA